MSIATSASISKPLPKRKPKLKLSSRIEELMKPYDGRIKKALSEYNEAEKNWKRWDKQRAVRSFRLGLELKEAKDNALMNGETETEFNNHLRSIGIHDFARNQAQVLASHFENESELKGKTLEKARKDAGLPTKKEQLARRKAKENASRFENLTPSEQLTVMTNVLVKMKSDDLKKDEDDDYKLKMIRKAVRVLLKERGEL